MSCTSLLLLALASTISAHTAAWADGMYCRNGNDTAVDEPNNSLPVGPLYNLTKSDWWFQHHRGCDQAPPKAGEFLNLPANGNFTVELAHNRAMTTLSYDGKFTSEWPDGKDHPENWNGWNNGGVPAVCLQEDGAMHTYNESSTGGTAFAISYQSDISQVTMENLVVFTTLEHTPWHRIATYQVPDLPACPEAGCTCAWLWIPNGCGQANMYMQGFKCNVTGATSTTPLAKAQVPTYCEGDASKCVKGAKQMLAWHQLDGNNIETEGWTTPNYNQKCGWASGAQHDIFESSGSPTPSSTSAVASIGSSTAAPYSTPVAASSVPVSSAVPYSTPVPSSVASISSAAPYSTPAASSIVPVSPTTLCSEESSKARGPSTTLATIATSVSSVMGKDYSSAAYTTLAPANSSTTTPVPEDDCTESRTKTVRHHRHHPHARPTPSA